MKRLEGMAAGVFVRHRERLVGQLPEGALVLVQGHDPLSTGADGQLRYPAHRDLYYLSGIDREGAVLVLFPGAGEAREREMLFVRETTPERARWEGPGLSLEEARERSGIATVLGLGELAGRLHRLMVQARSVHLPLNEHPRAEIESPDRNARWAAELRGKYPLHEFRRLSPVLHGLRSVKDAEEVAQIRAAAEITREGFGEAWRVVRPGVGEAAVEAELARAFLRRGGRFAFEPIVASGPNTCVLHYRDNNRVMREGELLLVDAASSYNHYHSDVTRTVPVGGKFTRRQRAVYEAVLRLLRGGMEEVRPGRAVREVQGAVEALAERELVQLGLLKAKDLARRRKGEASPCRKYFCHGFGHSLGLDVHDVTPVPEVIREGWVMTVEPGIYVPEEGLGVRLEIDVHVRAAGNVDLTAGIPLDAGEVEKQVRGRRGGR